MGNCQIVGVSEKKGQLSFMVSTTDRDCITMAAKNNSGNILICLLQILDGYIVVLKLSYLTRFFCSFYGSPLWHLKSAAVQSLCVD